MLHDSSSRTTLSDVATQNHEDFIYVRLHTILARIPQAPALKTHSLLKRFVYPEIRPMHYNEQMPDHEYHVSASTIYTAASTSERFCERVPPACRTKL